MTTKSKATPMDYRLFEKFAMYYELRTLLNLPNNHSNIIVDFENNNTNSNYELTESHLDAVRKKERLPKRNWYKIVAAWLDYSIEQMKQQRASASRKTNDN